MSRSPPSSPPCGARGTRFVGLCPYPDHSEKTPSFSVHAERNFYHCFGCSKGGDAIKLVMDLKAFSFVDAVSTWPSAPASNSSSKALRKPGCRKGT